MTSIEEKIKLIFGFDFLTWYCHCYKIGDGTKELIQKSTQKPVAYTQTLDLLRPIVDKIWNTQRCSKERPTRKVICQLPKGHTGSHSAVVYWEEE